MNAHDDTPALDTSFHDHEMDVDPDDWEVWATKVERLIGHSIDGDGEADGYSIDGAFKAWATGQTVEQAAKAIIANRSPTHRFAGD